MSTVQEWKKKHDDLCDFLSGFGKLIDENGKIIQFYKCGGGLCTYWFATKSEHDKECHNCEGFEGDEGDEGDKEEVADEDKTDEEEEDDFTPCHCLPDWDIRCRCLPEENKKKFERCPERVPTCAWLIGNMYEVYKEFLAGDYSYLDQFEFRKDTDRQAIIDMFFEDNPQIEVILFLLMICIYNFYNLQS